MNGRVDDINIGRVTRDVHCLVSSGVANNLADCEWQLALPLPSQQVGSLTGIMRVYYVNKNMGTFILIV
jgi:hypothetical protein